MSRAELLALMQATAANKPRAVTTKEWGTVFVRYLTVGEVDEQADLDRDREKANGGEPSKPDKYRIARSAARIICDEDGSRIFDPDDATDVALLASQPWPLLSEILNEQAEKKGDEAKN